MAEAALTWAGQTILTLPRELPHKTYSHTTLPERVELLLKSVEMYPQLGVAVTEGGLFAEIGAEAEEVFGREVELAFVCGADAAERIVNWDYGVDGFIDRMLERYWMLVAARGSSYIPKPAHATRILPLPLSEALEMVSSTEVRERIKTGREWRHLVPAAIHTRVQELYCCQPPPSDR